MEYKAKNIFLFIVFLIPMLISAGLILLIELNTSFNIYLPYYLIGSIVLVQLILIWMYRRYKETNTLYAVSIKNFTQLSEGQISLDNVPVKSPNANDFNSLQNKIVQYYSELQDVALNMSQGNLDISYQVKTSKDVLGETLINLKNKLIKISEEDKARAWSSNGLAEFVTLLREESDTKKLCDTVLSFIIKYINANQGSIYLLDKNDSEEDVLVTAAMYAYGRKKYLKQEIYPGDGLVGQCYYDKEEIYLTDIPDDYIKITSGLGEALPRCVILIPLLYNDKMQGVIEVASFQVWNDHEVNFLKRVAEYLASTLSSLKVTEQTKLLLERADQFNEELNSQSEEMRQNLEELQATQEEIERKNSEFTGLYLAVNQTMAIVELNKNGFILKVNENFSSLFNLPNESLEGKDIQHLINCNTTGMECHEILKKVLKNETFNGTFLTNSLRDNKWLSGTFSPMKDEKDQVDKILFLATDISKEKKLQLDTLSQAQELNKKMNEIEAERKKNLAILEGCVDGVLSFDSKGVVNFFNKAAEEIWETKRVEVIGKHITELIPIEIDIKNSHAGAYYSNGSIRKELSVRTEVSFLSSKGESVDALLTLTSASLGDEFNFTCFIQKISVDLF